MNSDLLAMVFVLIGLLCIQWVLIIFFYRNNKSFNASEVAGFGLMFSIASIGFSIAKYTLSILNIFLLFMLIANIICLVLMRNKLMIKHTSRKEE